MENGAIIQTIDYLICSSICKSNNSNILSLQQKVFTNTIMYFF